jgi:hypothetical protein
MIGGAHLSARRGEGRRRPEAGALSYDGGGNWAGCHQLAGLPGQWRQASAPERVGLSGRSGPTETKSKESFITDLIFLISMDFKFWQDYGNLYKEI